MIITFELLINDDIIDENIDVNLHTVKDIKKYINTLYRFSNIDVYQNTTLLSDNFNYWDTNYDYYVYINNNNCISFKIDNNITPFIDIKTKIKEVKDILSIKDDIYFNNIKLIDSNTLEYYNITNNTLIKTYSVVSCVV